VTKALKYLAKGVITNLLTEDLFRQDVDIDRVKHLFSTFVQVVEIENHSYCNRTCWFCPNSAIDRRRETILMSDALFGKLVRDLAAIQYSQTLVWSRYHEPLAHPSIFERVGQARKLLPGAHLALVSNGDYLSRPVLKRLEDTGLDRLMLDLYLPVGKERDDAVATQELSRFSERTGLSVRRPAGEFECVISGSRIRISMGIPNYTPENISTRGGLVHVPSLENYQRTASCFAPLQSVVVDYNGMGVLCCQTRSDAAAHQGTIVGDLNQPDYTLFHYYRDQAPARLALLSPGPKAGVCKTCTIAADGPDRMSRRPWIAKTLSIIPGLAPATEAVVRYQSLKRRWE
jgi:hypothetical protein